MTDKEHKAVMEDLDESFEDIAAGCMCQPSHPRFGCFGQVVFPPKRRDELCPVQGEAKVAARTCVAAPDFMTQRDYDRLAGKGGRI